MGDPSTFYQCRELNESLWSCQPAAAGNVRSYSHPVSEGVAAAALVLPGCSAAVETALGSRLMIVTVRECVCVFVLFPFSCACPCILYRRGYNIKGPPPITTSYLIIILQLLLIINFIFYFFLFVIIVNLNATTFSTTA